MTERNGSRRPGFDNKISLGNVLNLIGLIVVATIYLTDVKVDIAVIKTALASVVERVAKVEERVGLGQRPGPWQRGGRP